MVWNEIKGCRRTALPSTDCPPLVTHWIVNGGEGLSLGCLRGAGVISGLNRTFALFCSTNSTQWLRTNKDSVGGTLSSRLYDITGSALPRCWDVKIEHQMWARWRGFGPVWTGSYHCSGVGRRCPMEAGVGPISAPMVPGHWMPWTVNCRPQHGIWVKQ